MRITKTGADGIEKRNAGKEKQRLDWVVCINAKTLTQTGSYFFLADRLDDPDFLDLDRLPLLLAENIDLLPGVKVYVFTVSAGMFYSCVGLMTSGS